jgi:hypothetical protein
VPSWPVLGWTLNLFLTRLMRAACSVRRILLNLTTQLIFVTKHWLWIFPFNNIIHRHVLSVFASFFVYSLACLLTPWSRVLQELTGSQLVKKFPTFYGTGMFITAFTSACHQSLSSARLLVPDITLSILLPNRRGTTQTDLFLHMCVCVSEMCWLQQYMPTQY